MKYPNATLINSYAFLDGDLIRVAISYYTEDDPPILMATEIELYKDDLLQTVPGNDFAIQNIGRFKLGTDNPNFGK